MRVLSNMYSLVFNIPKTMVFVVQTLQHKNIVKCHKVYKATTHWVFVLEYLKGGMLLNDLSKVCALILLHTDSLPLAVACL